MTLLDSISFLFSDYNFHLIDRNQTFPFFTAVLAEYLMRVPGRPRVHGESIRTLTTAVPTDAPLNRGLAARHACPSI